jgi:hypothetical protein
MACSTLTCLGVVACVVSAHDKRGRVDRNSAARARVRVAVLDAALHRAFTHERAAGMIECLAAYWKQPPLPTWAGVHVPPVQMIFAAPGTGSKPAEWQPENEAHVVRGSQHCRMGEDNGGESFRHPRHNMGNACRGNRANSNPQIPPVPCMSAPHMSRRPGCCSAGCWPGIQRTCRSWVARSTAGGKRHARVGYRFRAFIPCSMAPEAIHVDFAVHTTCALSQTPLVHMTLPAFGMGSS